MKITHQIQTRVSKRER